MRPACLLVLVASFISPVLAEAQDAKSDTPATAPAAVAKRVVDLAHMSCGQYTALPEADRPAVVWYIAGYYKAAGDFMHRFDLDVAGRAAGTTAKQCADKPAASLRYTVGHVFAGLREEVGAKK